MKFFHYLFVLYDCQPAHAAFFQIRGMHTIIRDAATATHDFIFYADRLIRLVSIYTCIDEFSFIWFHMVALPVYSLPQTPLVWEPLALGLPFGFTW